MALKSYIPVPELASRATNCYDSVYFASLSSIMGSAPLSKARTVGTPDQRSAVGSPAGLLIVAYDCAERKPHVNHWKLPALLLLFSFTMFTGCAVPSANTGSEGANVNGDGDVADAGGDSNRGDDDPDLGVDGGTDVDSDGGDADASDEGADTPDDADQTDGASDGDTMPEGEDDDSGEEDGGTGETDDDDGGADGGTGGDPPPGGGGGQGGGSQGGDDDGDDDGGEPDPDPGPDYEPCTLDLTGTGANPGPGDGDLVFAELEFIGPEGTMATAMPVLPTLGAVPIEITPTQSQACITFECSDQITLGIVTFVDENGVESSPGEVTFDRGTDFACGQTDFVCGQPESIIQLLIRFSLPCSIEIELP